MSAPHTHSHKDRAGKGCWTPFLPSAFLSQQLPSLRGPGSRQAGNKVADEGTEEEREAIFDSDNLGKESNMQSACQREKSVPRPAATPAPVEQPASPPLAPRTSLSPCTGRFLFYSNMSVSARWVHMQLEREACLLVFQSLSDKSTMDQASCVVPTSGERGVFLCAVRVTTVSHILFWTENSFT